jgi:hypothetical protein
MFKHRAFQIKVVNTADPATPGHHSDEIVWGPAQLTEVGKEAIKTIVIAAAAFYAVKIALDTTKEIAVKRTPPNE